MSIPVWVGLSHRGFERRFLTTSENKPLPIEPLDDRRIRSCRRWLNTTSGHDPSTAAPPTKVVDLLTSYKSSVLPAPGSRAAESKDGLSSWSRHESDETTAGRFLITSRTNRGLLMR
jgi:hypothetical protein